MAALPYANWMEAYAGTIGALEPWQVILPGTHDSGSFSSSYYTGARNQSLNIGEQLYAGIRCFDIRVMQATNGNWLMQHSGYTDSSQSYPLALDQIAGFVASHPQEFIVILLSNNGVSLTAEQQTEATQLIQTHLGSLCVESNSIGPGMPGAQLSALVAAKKNVMVISWLNVPESYVWLVNDAIYGKTWQSFQSNGGTPPTESVPWTQEAITKALSSRIQQSPFDPLFLDANAVIWYCSPWIGHNDINPALVSWLPQWQKDNLGRALNIVSFDYVAPPGQDAVVDTILGMIPTLYTEAATPTCGGGSTVTMPAFVRSAGDGPGDAALAGIAPMREEIVKIVLSSTGLSYDKFLKSIQTHGKLTPADFQELERTAGL